MEKEQVKLVGGTSDGQTIEVYRGAEYAEVPFTLRTEGETIWGSEFYGRSLDQSVFVPFEGP